MCTSALRTLARIFDGYYHLATVITVPCRNAVSPPQLTADTPVTDVVGPVKVGLVHTLWKKFDISVLHTFHSRLDHLIHLYKPLLLDHRLNRCMTAVMHTDIVGMWNNFYQKSLFLKIIHQCFPALVAVHSGIFSGFFIHRCIVVDDNNFFQIMTLSNLKIVRVMCRSDLYASGSKFLVYISICDHRYFAVRHRKL